jgi:lon-related putative ATP-dependent protease
MVERLDASRARWRFPQEWLPAASTAEVEPCRGIIGQDRAVRALEFGLGVQSLGFNVFVTGLTGTGKMTAIELHLRPHAARGPNPDDLLYVFNFANAEQPRLLRLSGGKGAILRDQMERLLHTMGESLPGLFEGEDFQRRLEVALEDLKGRQQELIRSFEQEVREAGFTLVQVQVGSVTRPEILPLLEDRPTTLEKVQGLAEEGKLDRERLAAIEKEHARLSDELQRVFQQVMTLRGEMTERAEKLRRDMVEPVIRQRIEAIAHAVEDERAKPYLEDVAQDLMDHLELLAARKSEGEEPDPLIRYRVNLVVDNAPTEGRPVVIETDPSFARLFGTIEARLGPDWRSTADHTRIRAGSVLRANGGFLVVNAFDTVSEPGVWRALKRALRYRRVTVRAQEALLALSGQALQPEPVELDLKVVMIGDRSLYDLLHDVDEDFRKIFKVLSDFDSEMPNTRDAVRDFLSLMARIIRDEGLLHLDGGGMAALVEEGVRLARNRRRLSARFSDVADILREASFLAGRAEHEMVTAADVRAAVDARHQRHSLPEEKLTKLMLEEVLNIPTEGSAVGQVNGLAVYDLGYHAFGLPGRISARVALGREGVINIEREARLSGSTHDKGVLILGGYLRGVFARELPFSMSASIAFEQSYSGVDGDSASSTEAYAILSALSGLPIRQDLAVTGSVDQQGRVQAIGGVNEKVEGFFRLCAERGLSGTQGVLVPASNVADLQLEPDLVEAVAGERFHIYPITTIEEGVELLTGTPAGRRAPDGSFARDSVFGRCAARLAEMAEQLRRYREV